MHDPLAQFRKRPAGAPVGQKAEADGYIAFGAKDNVDRLEIRRVSPLMRAPGYVHLLDLVFDREGTTLVLVFDFMGVVVRGRNLQPIAMAVKSGTCDFIQEFDSERWAKPAANAPIIESIQIDVQENGPAIAAIENLGKTVH